MGTNNPSEEQLDLVTGRIIEIAQAVCPYIALEQDSYFDEMGFEGPLARELTTRLNTYVGNAEDVQISLDECPQPRRMARHMLENVEYDVLEKPLNAALLREADDFDAPKEVGSGLAGKRNIILAVVAILVLVLCIVAFIVLGGGGSNASSESGESAGHGGQGRAHGGGGHGGRGKAWRNGSA